MGKVVLCVLVISLGALLLAPMLTAPVAGAADLQGVLAKTPKGTESGQIDANAPKGFLGIPGAPSPSLIWGFLWAIWVGWIFSTVGAFGGIMAGVGHMTIFGLGDYARTFKQTNPALNKLLTDSIRVSNQWLVGLASCISSINYYRMGRLVAPLGIALAIGSVAGALLIPVLTAGKISFRAYQGWFGLCVLVIGARLLYETSPKGQTKRKEAKAAAAAFEKSVRGKGEKGEAAEVPVEELGVRVRQFSLKKVTFTFYGVEFHFNPILPVIGGLCVAAIASFLGVGGGFLYVPFLTSIVGLPMFLVAGTSALCVFIGMVVSIFSYMVIKGAVVSWGLIGAELVGIFIGAMIGPRTQKYIPDIWLKRLFVLLAIYVGIRYGSKGFFGQSWFPPY